MLVVKDLSLSIDGSEILKEINIDFSEGGLITILGPNGSGKSSLIKCIAGIYDNWIGEILIDGVDIRTLSTLERARIISYVPQILEVHADYSVWDFFEMSYFSHLSTLRGLSKDEIEKGESILKSFNLLNLKERSLITLSGGERQRVFIAASLFQGPKLLLLDEPTSFLDPRVQDDINKIIYSLRDRMDIVLISHDIGSTLVNSQRIIGLKSGENFFDGSANEILVGELDNLFDKTFTLVKHPHCEIETVAPEVFR